MPTLKTVSKRLRLTERIIFLRHKAFGYHRAMDKIQSFFRKRFTGAAVKAARLLKAISHVFDISHPANKPGITDRASVEITHNASEILRNSQFDHKS